MILIPLERLAPDTLTNLIEEFVTRDGTDYGEMEASLPEKVAQIRKGLASGEMRLVYDEQSEACTIMSKDAWRAYQQERPAREI